LPNDNNRSNEANSELEEDTRATFAMNPLVTYLNDPYCNIVTENDHQWVLNEDIDFDYSLCFDDVLTPPTQAPCICPYPHQ